jgi:flavin reductase (DIM6/NTAB) family NADH-FMN oxidoreductase RutF
VSDRRLRHADADAFRHAMGALSSGVAITACGAGEARAGCTATSVTSLSLAPPTLIVCLARTSTTLAGLREAGAFSINLLAARHQAFAHRFSGHSGVHGPRRFDSAQWVTLSTGAPVLADALAAFDCLERRTFS